ncbi:MAG: hypothetical protein EAZ53_15375, partial [Bacteroidetes bacterium]
MKSKIILLVSLLGFSKIVSGQTLRYWVSGGNGFWTSSTNWSTSSGGTSGASVPIGTSLGAVFDANSGTPVVNLANGLGSSTVLGSLLVSNVPNITFTGGGGGSNDYIIGAGHPGVDLSILNSNVLVTGGGGNAIFRLSNTGGNTGNMINSTVLQRDNGGTGAFLVNNNTPFTVFTIDGTSTYIAERGPSFLVGIWQDGSKMIVRNSGLTPALMDQNFYDLIFNIPAASMTVSSLCGVRNSITVQNSNTTGVILGANYSLPGGLSVSGTGTINLSTFNYTFGGVGIVGSANRIITNNNNLTYNISSPSSLPSNGGSAQLNSVSINSVVDLSLTGNTNISNNLTLNNGVILLGANSLSVAGSVLGSFSNNSMISQNNTGRFIKTYSSLPSTFVFPVGRGSIGASNNIYMGLDMISLTATAPANGTLSVFASETPPTIPNISVSNQAIKKYWNINAPGLSNVNASFTTTFTGVDLANIGLESEYVSGYNISPSILWTPGLLSEVNNKVISFNLVGSDNLSGNYSAGNPLAFASPTLYTYKNGSWNDPNTWTLDPSGTSLVSPQVPSPSSTLYFLNGRTVTLPNNISTTGHNLIINSGSTLDLKTFRLSTLSGLAGQGTLRLNSNQFPTVVGLNTFVEVGGGTTEYYDLSTTLPSYVPKYNNLIVSKYDNSANNYVYKQNGNLVVNGFLKIFNSTNTGTSTLEIGGTVASNITVLGSFVVGDAIGGPTNAVASLSGANFQHRLVIFGDLLNYGTVDFSNNAQFSAPTTQTLRIEFKGSSNNAFFCDGPTEIYDMTVNKGTDQTYILSLSATSPTHFRFMTDLNGFPILMGTLRLGNNIVLDRLKTSGNFDIGSDINSGCQLWIDGASVSSVCPTGSNGVALVPYGKFRITSGSITVTGAGIVPRYDGEIFIEGGYVNVPKIRTSVVAGVTPRGTFFMSGGVLDINGNVPNKEGFGDHSVFMYPFEDASYIVSGGTINIYSIGANNNFGSSLFVLNSLAKNINVTGGTTNMTISGAVDFNNNINSSAPFYNLNIFRTTTIGGNRFIALKDLQLDPAFSSPGYNTFIPARPLTVLNKLYIDGTNAPLLSLSGQSLFIKKDLELAPNSRLEPTSSDVYFDGSVAQDITMNSTFLGIARSLNFSNSSANSIFLKGTLSNFTTNGLNITSGFVNDGGKTIKVLGNVLNNGRIFGNGKIEFVGSSAVQNINGNGSGVFGNVDLNNTNPASDGVKLNTNASVKGVLNLVSNKTFDINTFKIRIDSTAAANGSIISTGASFSNTKFIKTSGNQSDGGVEQFVLNNNSFLVPIGTNSTYSPINVSFTGVTGASNQGYIQMSVNNAVLSTLSITGVPNSALLYNWRVRASGFISMPSVSYTFNSSVAGMWPTGVIGTPSNFVGGKVIIPNRFPETTTVTSNGLILISSHTVLADASYTAAQVGRFNGNVRIFYTRNSDWGSGAYWDDANTWSFTSNSGPADTGGLIPGPNDIVYHGYGYPAGSGTQGPFGGAGPPTNGYPHWTSIRNNITVAGVIFQDFPISTAWYTAIYLRDNVNANLGVIRNQTPTNSSGSILYYIDNALNRATLTADLGEFSKGSLNEIYYILRNNGSVQIQPGITEYPNMRLEGEGGASGTRIFNFPDNNVLINGYVNLTGRGNVLQMSATTTSGGNVTIKGNLNLQNFNEGDSEFRFPSTGTAKTLNVGGLNILNNSAETGSSGAPTANFGVSVDNSTPSSITHKLIVNNNITHQQGRFNLFNGNNPTDNNCTLEFQGTFSGRYLRTGGTVPNLYKLNINKSNANASFSFNSSANLLGNGNETIKPITFNSGLLILSSSGINFNLSSGGAVANIPCNAGLQVENGAIVSMSSTTGLVLDGKLTIGNNGTANFNDGTNNTFIEYSTSGCAELNVLGNASLNVGSQIRRSLFSNAGVLKYTQTGGNVTIGGLGAVATNAKFELDNAGSSISMTGGNFYIQRGGGNATFGDLYLDPGTSNITGGSFIFSPLNAGSNQIYRLISNPSLHNVSISGSGANTANVNVLVNPLVINNNFNLSTNGSLSANGFGLNLKGNSTISGSYVTAGNTTSFTGSGLQNLVLLSAVSFNNFLVNKSNSLSVTGLNTTVAGLLSVINGTLDNTNSLVSTADVFNSSIITGLGKLVMGGTLPKSVTGNDNGIFNNIDITNFNGVNFYNAISINGNLNFINDGIYMDDNQLTLGLNSSIIGFNAYKFIRTNGVSSDDGVIKVLPATTFNYTFPVGYFGKYTPVTYQATSNSATGSIKVIPVNKFHPLNTDPANTQLDYYWIVTSSGFSGLTVNHTYTYSQADVVGTESLYKAGRSINGDWVPYYGGFASSIGGVNLSNNQIFVNGVNFVFGEYTAGETSEFQQVLTYYSRDATTGGNWDDVNSWSTIGHNGSIAGFTPVGQPVIIKQGHTIFSNGNLREAYSTSLSGVLDLNTSFGHNLGIIRGNGTIRIASDPSLLFVLPAGQMTAFLNTTTGGTFEFYGTNGGDIPALNPPDFPRFNNVLLSGIGSRNITSNCIIGGNLSITGGVLRVPNNSNITIYKNWINTVGVGGFAKGSTAPIMSFVELLGTNQSIIGSNLFAGLLVANGGVKSVSANNSVSGTLNLSNGIVDMGSNTLSMITTDANVIGGSANSFVKGLLQKRILTSGVAVNYEVGENGYSPLSVTFPSVSSQGNLAVKAVAGAHPQISTSCINSAKRVNRYWNIVSSNPVSPLNYNATATFNNPADILGGANTSLFIPSIYTSSVWSLPGVGTRNSTSTQATGITYFGDLIIGEPSSPVGVTIVGPAMPVCAGTILNFTANGVNGGTSPGYNWYKDVSGTTTAGLALTQVFSTTALGNGDIVRVTYTSSQASCLFNNPAVSNGITVSYGASGQWIGAVSNVWTVPGNWCGGIVPTSASDAVINTAPTYPLITATTDIRNFNLGVGTNITISSPFRIAGDFVNNGNFIVTGNNQFQLNGSGNQAISGSSITRSPNLQIWGAGTKTLNSGVEVSNRLTMGSTSAVLASNGNLTLLSNASGTASVSSMSGTAAITGNVRVQNYMGSKINRRYLSFPVSGATLLQLKSSIWLNGPASDANFDTPNFIPSVLVYDETMTGQVNIGKKVVTSTSQTFATGVGYEILVRPRTVASNETRANQPTTPVTLEVVGTLNQGNQTIPISFTNTGNGTADGYNFVGNPYPSNIDWTVPGWTKTNIAPSIYFLDPGSSLTATTSLAGQSYTYIPGTGCVPAVAGCNSLIAQGQGFYVLATASGAVLSATESVKSIGVARRNFRTEEDNSTDLIRVTATAPNGMIDETVLRVGDSFTDGYDNAAVDVKKFPNANINLSTKSQEGYNLVLNSMPIADTNKVIPLVFASNISGVYSLKVSTNSLATSAPQLYIRNNADSSLVEVTSEETVTFVHVSSVTSAPKYSLVMKKPARVETPQTPQEQQNPQSIKENGNKNSVMVYPNPFSEGITIVFGKAIEEEVTIVLQN